MLGMTTGKKGNDMTDHKPTGYDRRERIGSEKRKIGAVNMGRMLPWTPTPKLGGDPPPNIFAPDLALMGLEDSYCDMWDRTEVIDLRTRSLFNVSLMVGVGNVTNPFEIGFHAPGLIANGGTIRDLEAIATIARAYVGSPASGWAMMTMMKSLQDQGLYPERFEPANVARKELKGSEKRAIARDLLREIDPESPLMDVPEDHLESETFAPELDFMILEGAVWDIWARTDDVDRRTKLVITLGLLMGLGNAAELTEFLPFAVRNGITRPELEEFVYQAATYLGFASGKALRRTIAAALEM
jgi:4-carboxymuconolactone decarboxylase